MSRPRSPNLIRFLVVGTILVGASETDLPIVVADDAADGQPSTMLLFDSGREGYPRYRIPALIVALNGGVLAFCEGRADGGGFKGNIDLVLKRSSDSGQTWGSLQTIADGGPHTFGYPVPVVDRETEMIWLVFTRSRGDDTEQGIVDGTSRESTRVLVMSSLDHGVSWNEPVDVTPTAKQPGWTWYGVGSGIGIQLRDGRLVVPAYHAVETTKFYRSHMLYSDDHGRTWRAGDAVADGCGECQIAERRDGTLYINARNHRGATQRVVATSRDRGVTWEQASHDPALFDPLCQGAVYTVPSTHNDDKPLWLFSNPAGPKRRDLTIRVSRDEGRTWSAGRRLQDGSSEYSCLTELPDGRIGCLYERWEDNNYRIRFARLSLKWLSDLGR